MSTKTTFKRIALVAVAALGLGVLSVAPSTASVGTQSITAGNGTSSTALNYDSSTAATFAWSARMDSTDTVTVTVAPKAIPTGATANTPQLRYIDSTSAANSFIGTISTATQGTQATKLDTVTAAGAFFINASTSGYVGANFRIELDSATARTAGTYTYTVTTKTYAGASATVVATTDTDVSIVVSAVASASKVANSGTSTAVLQAGSSFTTGSTQDSAVAVVATASSVDNAVIGVNLKNASGTTSANESITATITGPGVIGAAGGTYGKSVLIKHTAGADFLIGIRADGTAGVATVSLSTPSVTFSPKTVLFYAKSPKTITASINNPVLNVGTNDKAVKAVAVDANGLTWTGQLYIVASTAADALVGGSATAPVPCLYDATKAAHYCPVTTLAAGTASFTVIDQTLALGTETAYGAAMTAATSNAVAVTVSSAVAATVKLAFDKASYAPFEKAIITVTPLDSAGKTLGTKTITNLFATGGITTNVAFGSSSDTLTAVTLTTSADASSTAPRTAGAYTYIVYMPAQGSVTISATGGTGLAAAGQVAVTASATIVNSSVDAATDAANEATDAANAATDAALAAADAADAATAAAQDASDAVAALSATVATLVASLKAQITSLTNLVIKIQKKVKA